MGNKHADLRDKIAELLTQAAKELREHNGDYHHRTAPEFLDALTQAVSLLGGAAPLQTCQTCAHFVSTANKARYPEANAGVCRKTVLADDNGKRLQVWEMFGCTLHQPVASPPEEERTT